MAEMSSRCEEEIEMAIRNGYLTTDREFLRESVGGGTCCVTALIHKGNLVVSNTGDCRAVMSRGGVAEALTSDHHPSREDERERIEALVSCCFYCTSYVQDSTNSDADTSETLIMSFYCF